MTNHPANPARPPDGTPEPGDPATYADAAAVEDDKLDAALVEIRRRTDTGEITMREAADERCSALEQHIAKLAELRARYLG